MGIKELLQHYCPNGVKIVPLGEVCSFKRGNTITAKEATAGDVPVIAGGQTPSYYHNQPNRVGETISVAGSGAYAGFVNYWTIPVFLSDAFSVHPSDCLTPRYVFHFLKLNQQRIYEFQKGAGVPHVHGKDLAKLEIPLPPLPVQQEIVRVLDSFSELQANLQQELDVRKKQFKAYQELFMTEIDESYEKKSLGELFSFKNGLNKGKEFFGEGTPIIMFSNVFNHRALYNEAITSRVTITEKELARIDAKRGDVFFTRTSETQEDVGMSSVLLDDIKSCTFSGFLIRARPHTDLLLPDYCRFCFGSSVVRASIVSNSIYTTRASLTGAGLSKVFISIPPREVQQKKVSILNSFEQLVQNIKEEIIVRQKQYEYYREKLLTF